MRTSITKALESSRKVYWIDRDGLFDWRLFGKNGFREGPMSWDRLILRAGSLRIEHAIRKLGGHPEEAEAVSLNWRTARRQGQKGLQWESAVRTWWNAKTGKEVA